MIKVHISPWFERVDRADGGIRRVVEAMIKHLPQYGVTPVRNPNEAHIINNHGQMLTKAAGVPLVHTGHGLYWSRQAWGDDFYDVNRQVIESMCQSVAHTVPSEWVGRAVRRGGYFYPEVIYHGVDTEEFEPVSTPGNFVLWNKARADFVSDPNDLMKMAGMLPNVEFKTTIGNPSASNVEVLGMMSHNKMLEVLSQAGVYLATARETFGIGTLEALAYGIPVAGWDWGGQSEIIVQGQTGYLAPPGDWRTLAECIMRCVAERDRLSQNAVADARTRWRWEQRIEQYADIFKRVYEDVYGTSRPAVSVLVTAYNLDKYLPKCLESVIGQTMGDFECLVIDDAQSDSTKELIRKYSKKDKRIKYQRTPHNVGLPGARNFGFGLARGRYIRHLDADDYLAENALELESQALDDHPEWHIVYGHLEVVREDGSRIIVPNTGEAVRGGWPETEFDWYKQMGHLNQLPSCSMMRREVLERSGGYRERMKRQEDAEFWCRVTSLGFRAKKFTEAVTYFHRQRADSKGAVEWRDEGKEPDWTAWFPWRMGAKGYEEAIAIWRKYGKSHPKPYLVPFGAQGKPERMRSWYVHDYAYPTVSVIVTCGPGHEKFLMDALDSVQAQTYPDWECIVVNDTGKDWGKDIMGAPFARVVNLLGNQGAAAARNAGIPLARGRNLIWLDADDYWMPWLLERMVAYGEVNDGIIFSDFIEDDGKKLKIYRYQDLNINQVALKMNYSGTSVLIPRKIIQKVVEKQGGWDTHIPGMEDWDFQVAMHDACACAHHIHEPLFVYRKYSSSKRERDYNHIDDILKYMDEKWSSYRRGEKNMAGCGCGGGTQQVQIQAQSLLGSSGNFVMNIPLEDGEAPRPMVTVEYRGPLEESFTIRSRAMPGKIYRFGNNQYDRHKTVLLEDAEFLMGMLDGNGISLYTVVGAGAVAEVRDPTVFLGQAIT